MKYNPEIPRTRYNEYGNKEWERLEKDSLGDLLYHVHLDILKRYISDSDNVIELGAGRFTKDIVNTSKSLTTSDMGPSRKLFKLNDAGREELRRFWERWEFVSSKINELKEKK